MSNKLIFDELVTSSALELFQARGTTLKPAQRMDGAIEYAATLGFAADHARGMLGLGMSPTTLHTLVQRELIPISEANTEDWLAESVNQLVGRLKNKLFQYDLVVSLALPTVLRGLSLNFLSRGSESLWRYSFDSDAGPVSVWLDVRCEATLVLRASEEQGEQSASEGDLLLF
jgi:hypothetical protein